MIKTADNRRIAEKDSHCAHWQIGKALPTVDLKFRLPPRFTESESDLDRWSILELTDGTPLSVITVDIDSGEVHEAEPWQRNSRNDGGILLRALLSVDPNLHVFALCVLSNSSDRAFEQSVFLRAL